MPLTPDQIEALFTRSDGTYAFARWGRPIAPIVFGVTDEALSVIKGAWEAVAMLAGHTMAETDPQLFLPRLGRASGGSRPRSPDPEP